MWGNCVGCPKWNSCCTRVSDPVCEGANSLCRITRTAAYTSLSGARAAYNAAQAPLNAAKFALEQAKTTVQSTKGGFDAANQALKSGQNALSAGLKVITDFGNSVFSSAVEVKSIRFSASAEALLLSSVTATVDVSYFGKSDSLTISLDLKSNPIAIVTTLAERITPGVNSLLRGRRTVQQIAREVPSGLKTPSRYVTNGNNFEQSDGQSNDDYRSMAIASSQLSVFALENGSRTTTWKEFKQQLAFERYKVRQETVNRLSNSMARQVLSWNESAQSNINKSHVFSKPQEANGIQGAILQSSFFHGVIYTLLSL